MDITLLMPAEPGSGPMQSEIPATSAIVNSSSQHD